MEMTLEQLHVLTPAIRLLNGFEMAAYRIALGDSLSEDTVSSEESKILAYEYDKVLEFYCMAFRPEIN